MRKSVQTGVILAPTPRYAFLSHHSTPTRELEKLLPAAKAVEKSGGTSKRKHERKHFRTYCRGITSSFVRMRAVGCIRLQLLHRNTMRADLDAVVGG